MSIRYNVDRGFLVGQYLVYDNVVENYVFRGTYDECHAWVDRKVGLCGDKLLDLA